MTQPQFKRIGVRVEVEDLKTISKGAKVERRSVSNFLVNSAIEKTKLNQESRQNDPSRN